MDKDTVFIQTLEEKERELEEMLKSVRQTKALFTGNQSVLPKIINSHSVQHITPQMPITVGGLELLPYEELRGKTRIDKLLYAIDKVGRFIHKSDLETMTGLNNISTDLSAAKRDGTMNLGYYQYNNQKSKTFWGRKTWLDENGNILNGYEYKER